MNDPDKVNGELVHACKGMKEAIEIYGTENIEAWDVGPDGITPILTDEFLGK